MFLRETNTDMTGLHCSLPQEQNSCNSGNLAMTPFGPLSYYNLASPSNDNFGVAECTQYFSLMW